VAKDKEVDDGASTRAVDAEIARNVSETQSETGGLRDGDSRDADENQEEV
jgi:hypothetical protein